MGALALTGIAVILIAVLVDVPHLNDKGVWPLSDQYEDAAASAGIGFYFETASGVLMLLGGVLSLLLAPRRSAAPKAPRERPRRETPAVDESPVVTTPATSTSQVGDWFAEDPLASRAQRLTQPPEAAKRRSGGLVGRFKRRSR
jgi:hypothetical protein